MANTALRLAALASRLALEERTLLNHPTGRAENVAEHSAMLAIVAPAIAEMYYPQLDANLISRFAAIHDAVEAYAGDTTTHVIDKWTPILVHFADQGAVLRSYTNQDDLLSNYTPGPPA